MKFNLPKWVLGILALVLILRIPSFFEPYYYGDEMIYLSLGQGVKHGLTLYKDIHDNKPPLLYLLASVSENLFVFKAILCFWNLVTVTFFYKLAQIIFKSKFKNNSEDNLRKTKFATIIFAILTTIPLFEGNIVNSELFLIGFSIIGLYILLPKKQVSQNTTAKQIFLAGIMFGIGTLFKVPAMFDLPIIIVYWFITTDFKNWGEVFKKTFILFLGFATPILITFIFFYFKGALPDYIKAAFLQNVGYLSSFRPGDIQKPFYIRNAPLIARGLVVLVGSIILFICKRRLTKKFILISLWVLFGLFAVTLSERPYPHYFIQVAAPISLLFSIFFVEKSVEQSLTIIPLFLAFFVPFYYKFYYYQSGSYYNRFINFSLGRINKTEYFQSFSSTTTRNYEISKFLSQSSRPTDNVFMWDSDSAVVYALSRRLPPIKYVADYHVNDFSSRLEVAKQLEVLKPKFIILTSSHPYPEINMLIKSNYVLVHQVQNANIYSRLNLVQK